MSSFLYTNPTINLLNSLVLFIKKNYSHQFVFDLESAAYYGYGLGNPTDTLHLAGNGDTPIKEVLEDWADVISTTVNFEVTEDYDNGFVLVEVTYKKGVFYVSFRLNPDCFNDIRTIDSLCVYTPTALVYNFYDMGYDIVSITFVNNLLKAYENDIDKEALYAFYNNEVDFDDLFVNIVKSQHPFAQEILYKLVQNRVKYRDC